MPSPQDNMAICMRFFDAVEAGDQPALAALIAPGAVIWHNYDDVAMPFAELLPALVALPGLVPGIRYVDRRYVGLPDGIFAQHRLKGLLPPDMVVDVPLAVRITLEDGKVSRMDEYIDAASIANIVAAAQRVQAAHTDD